MARLCTIIAFSLLSACGPQEPIVTPLELDGEPARPAGFLPFNPEPSASFSAGPEVSLRRVITSTDEWTQLWRQLTANHTPARDVPHIDFAKYSLIVATRGKVADSSHTIDLNHIEDGPDKSVVHVREVDHVGSGCVALLAEGYPVAMGLVEKSTKAVTFSVTQVSRGCVE